MVLLRFCSILFLLILISSCAKVNYLWNQGLGQVSLLTKARKNQEVLDDILVHPLFKKKIRLIEEYKKYFYNFWEKKESPIYSKTRFLDQKAVTYLVIASVANEIKAKKECFPFMGCFPYLGFFEKEDAIKHIEKLKSDKYQTYLRPVYAYSSLGYFDDVILSSFFEYDEFGLAELVFHELFHTIFFIKGEVDLNENLANFFGKEMAKIYFSNRNNEFKEKELLLKKKEELNRSITKLAQDLNQLYTKNSSIPASEVQKLFLKDTFTPFLKKKCKELSLNNCYPLNGEWNNARFAAFLTYEKQGSRIVKKKESLNLDLKSFFGHIEREYKNYKKNKNGTKQFSDYLLK